MTRAQHEAHRATSLPWLQSKPPPPSSPQIFLVLYNPKPHIFARAFRHRATDDRIIHEARHLWAALDESGVDYLVSQRLARLRPTYGAASCQRQRTGTGERRNAQWAG
jgi:hypothetical protein